MGWYRPRGVFPVSACGAKLMIVTPISAHT